MNPDSRDALAMVEKLLEPGEELSPGASVEELQQFEERTGVKLPPDVREWLSVTNGSFLPPGGFYGVCPDRPDLDIEPMYEAFPGWKANQWIPIAGDGVGDYYVVDSGSPEGQPVLFIDPHEEPDRVAYVVASGLWRFLSFIAKKELGQSEWPFDRRQVLQEDPGIEAFHRYPMPWQK